MSCEKAAVPANVIMGKREGIIYRYQKGALKKSKSYYACLIAPSQSGVARLEIYENEKHSHSLQPSFMVVGSDVVKVERIMLAAEEMRNAFLISTRDQHYTFYVKTPEECIEWVKCIQQTLLGVGEVRRCSKEVSDIYITAETFSTQTSEFMVMTDEETRMKMSVDGKVKLVVEAESILIITPSGKMIVRWNLKDIRRFYSTTEAFFVEVGRKSTIGEGRFGFLTDKGSSIDTLVKVNKGVLKQKMQATKHHAFPTSLPVTGSQSPLGSVAPVTYWNDDSSEIYDTLEEVMPSSSTKLGQSHAGNIHHHQVSPALAPRSTLPSTAIQDNKPPSLSQHSKQAQQVGTNNQAIDQAQAAIYSEPQIITDAWKSHGSSDSEDTALYSNLNFPHREEVESHYWQGTSARPPVNAKSEKEETQVEEIYAQIDLSKKLKNRK